MISNFECWGETAKYAGVSIPNGDKHDFKLVKRQFQCTIDNVSIPNGDKHDFKPTNTVASSYRPQSFQSPMGISMISNSFALLSCLNLV